MQVLLEEMKFSLHAAHPNVATGPSAAWLESTLDPSVVVFGRYSSQPLPGCQPSTFGSWLDGTDRLQWGSLAQFANLLGKFQVQTAGHYVSHRGRMHLDDP